MMSAIFTNLSEQLTFLDCSLNVTEKLLLFYSMIGFIAISPPHVTILNYTLSDKSYPYSLYLNSLLRNFYFEMF